MCTTSDNPGKLPLPGSHPWSPLPGNLQCERMTIRYPQGDLCSPSRLLMEFFSQNLINKKLNTRNPNPTMKKNREMYYVNSTNISGWPATFWEQHLLMGKLPREHHGACCLVFFLLSFCAWGRGLKSGPCVCTVSSYFHVAQPCTVQT